MRAAHDMLSALGWTGFTIVSWMAGVAMWRALKGRAS